MEIKKIKIKKLKRATYSPRLALDRNDTTYQMIKASIEKFGNVQPIIINVRNNNIIDGNIRILVLEDLGFDEVDCVLLDLDERTEKHLSLSLNNLDGYWDNEKLKILFEELQLTEEELFVTGFSEYEIENLKNDFISELLEDDFINTNSELDKFSITFNIDKKYKKIFDNYIKRSGKEELVNCLIKYVEEQENA